LRKKVLLAVFTLLILKTKGCHKNSAGWWKDHIQGSAISGEKVVLINTCSEIKKSAGVVFVLTVSRSEHITCLSACTTN
ncbi:unnamed protein product, partial [Ixodes pacificus]